MNNNNDEPFVPTEEYREVAASVRRLQREALSQEFRGIRSPEEAATQAVGRLRGMFGTQEEAPAIPSAFEYGYATDIKRKLGNCKIDKNKQPLVCYGCVYSIRGIDFPGKSDVNSNECENCIRNVSMPDHKTQEGIFSIDRYIAEDCIIAIHDEWNKTQRQVIKEEARQEILDEMVEEKRILSPKTIKRIILRNK